MIVPASISDVRARVRHQDEIPGAQRRGSATSGLTNSVARPTEA
jgi:hypothetical protein